MGKISHYYFLFVSLSIISCDIEDPQIITVQNGPPGIYVGGSDANGTAIWKDGTPTQLPGNGSGAQYIFVNGNDIYLAGKSYTGTGGNTNSFVYWKNGTSSTMLDLNAENFFSQLDGFTVSGNDLHAVWTQNKGRNSFIKHWKNGVITSITDSTHYAKSKSLFVYGQDVYICGYESTGGIAVAKYWKNGKAFTLTDGKASAVANSMFVYQGDVYVAGMASTSTDISKDITVARYWKNSTGVDLTDKTKNAGANSIFVNDEGIFVAGSEAVSTQSGYQVAKYWKNNVVSSLTNGALSGSAYQITVSDKDVYVVGKDAQFGTIWKNGIKLPPFDTNDPSILPLCISVIK